MGWVRRSGMKVLKALFWPYFFFHWLEDDIPDDNDWDLFWGGKE